MKWSRLLIAIVFGAACGGSTETPTSPTTTEPTITTVTFASTLAVSATRFYSFTVRNAGTVRVMLASVTAPNGATLSTALTLGVGVPSGTGCALQASIVTGPGLVTQLEHVSDAGVRCVSIADPGGLAGPVAFAIRFTHP